MATSHGRDSSIHLSSFSRPLEGSILNWFGGQPFSGSRLNSLFYQDPCVVRQGNATPKDWTVLINGHCVATLTYPVVGIRGCLLFSGGFWLTFLYPLIYHDLGLVPLPSHLLGQKASIVLPFLFFWQPGSRGWSKRFLSGSYWSPNCWPRKVFISCFDAENDHRRFSTCFFSWPFQQLSQRPLWKWPKACCSYLSWRLSYGWKLLLSLDFSRCLSWLCGLSQE